MGFLTSAAREKEPDTESNQLETLYMKAFPKIGRDFVHIDDFIYIIDQILEIIDPDNNSGIMVDNSNAIQRAREYRNFLNKNKKGSSVYSDLIDLEEDSDV